MTIENLNIPVSADFATAVSKLYMSDSISGRIVMSDHGDGKGIILTKWEIDAPLPTEEEIVSALLITEKVDSVSGLKSDIAILMGRLSDLEAKTV